MEKLVLSEHDLSARWGVSIKTLQRWRKERCGSHYLTIGRRVSYKFKDVEHFETHALYDDRPRKAIDEPSPINVQTSDILMSCKGPRAPQQEVIDLIATALLRLRADGPVPKNSPQTPSNNPTQPKDPIRLAPSKRVLDLISERCK